MGNGRNISSVLLVATMFVGVFGIGGLPVPILMFLVVSSCVAMIFAWMDKEEAVPRAAATALFFAGVLLVSVTAFSLLPLPMGLLRAIAPANAEIWSRTLAPLHEAGPAYAPISLDPIATRVELARGMVYLFSFVAALRIARRKEGEDFLCRTLVLISLVAGIVSLLHPLMNAERVYGFYRPLTAVSLRHLGPIMNPNCLAALLNVGILVAFAMATERKPTVPRPLVVAVALVIIAVQLWVASRGGVATLLLGTGLLLALRGGRRAASTWQTRVIQWAPVVFMVLGVVATVLMFSDDASDELADSDVGKLRSFTPMLPMLKKFPLFGTGRGAFESVYPAIRTGNVHLVVNNPENVFLQWAIEWGIIPTLLALGLIAYGLRPRVAMARRSEVLGPWVALIVVALQNQVDLSSEIPGVMIIMSVAAGMVAAGSGNQSAKVVPVFRRPVLFGSLAAVTLILLWGAWNHELYDERATARAMATDASVSQTAMHDYLRGVMLRHPAEPYFPHVGAIRAARAHDESPIPWVAKTLTCAPVYAPSHLLLAHFLTKMSPSQARTEYRLAVQQEPELAQRVGQESAGLVSSYDDALELIPEMGAVAPLYEGLASAVRLRLPAVSWQLDDRAIARFPTIAPPFSRHAAARISDLSDPSAVWCADAMAQCADRAEIAARELIRVLPGRCDGYAFSEWARFYRGDMETAMKGLFARSEHVEDRVKCLQSVVDMARIAKSETRITQAVDEIARAGCASTQECVANLAYAASIEQSRNHLQRALGFTRKAADRDPSNDELLANTAALASQAGLHKEARDTYARILKRRPGDARFTAAIQNEDAQLARVMP